jgi:hypothetical protein
LPSSPHWVPSTTTDFAIVLYSISYSMQTLR